MSRTKLYGQIFDVEIIDTTVDGKGVARLNDKVFFVANAVPGDKVQIKVISKKRRFFEAKLENIISPSEYRTVPKCKHFGICGGCRWQHMTYESQLLFKEKQVVDQFERIGKIIAPHNKIERSPELFYYRNKLEFTFSTNKWHTNPDEPGLPVLGFHIPGRFDKILDIEECFLQSPPSNEIRNCIKKIALLHNIPFYNTRTYEGFLRNLIIRNNSKKEFMLILSVKYFNEQWIELITENVKKHFPQVVSFYIAINDKLNDSLDNVPLKKIYGVAKLSENIAGLVFNVSPKAFMQVNYSQTLNLYKKILDLANFTYEEIVYDLYCGIGTISLLLAQKAKHVVGIEYVDEAVKDAIENAKANNITNASFFSGDVKEVLNSKELLQNYKPDVIVLDPPRAGIHPDVIQKIIELNVKKIIYVSCNAATQARDINLLGGTYKVTYYQPFDMFPHTNHVENIAILENFSTKYDSK